MHSTALGVYHSTFFLIDNLWTFAIGQRFVVPIVSKTQTAIQSGNHHHCFSWVPVADPEIWQGVGKKMGLWLLANPRESATGYKGKLTGNALNINKYC